MYRIPKELLYWNRGSTMRKAIFDPKSKDIIPYGNFGAGPPVAPAAQRRRRPR